MEFVQLMTETDELPPSRSGKTLCQEREALLL